jgi:hypothetical protein
MNHVWICQETRSRCFWPMIFWPNGSSRTMDHGPSEVATSIWFSKIWLCKTFRFISNSWWFYLIKTFPFISKAWWCD